MRLSNTLLIGTVSLLLVQSTCAYHSLGKLSGENEVLRKTISLIASKRERGDFDRAARAGPYTLKIFMENFWARRDPTSDTEANEYRKRFEVRLARASQDFTPAPSEYPDDRIVAYIHYGWPTLQEELAPLEGNHRVGWVYRPDPDIAAAGSGHRLLKNLEYVVTFQRDESGVHTLLPVGKRAWKPPLPSLSYREVRVLEGILYDTDNDSYLRAAAAWRLRADAGWTAFRALLYSSGTDDALVYRVIADAIQPLVAVRFVGSDEIVIALKDPESRAQTLIEETEEVPVPEGWEMAIPRDAAVPVSGTTSDLLSAVYDPTIHFSPHTVTSLRTAAAEADSFLHSRGWLTPEEADALYVGPLEIARSLLDTEDPIDAHDLLDPLLRREYKDDAEAWHLDALALLESASPGGRQLAEERIRQALRLDPGNLRYRLALAEILDRRTLAYYADDTLDRILDEAPTIADAYALKARMRLENYWLVGWRAGGWGGLPLEERRRPSNIRRAEATDMLNKALILDPDNAFATWWLGDHYVLARRWREMIPVMNYLIQQEIHVPEALLARGLAFQHLGQLEQAMQDYEAGLSLLPPEVRIMAEDPRWVLPPSQGGVSLKTDIKSLRSVDRTGITTGQEESYAGPGEARDRFWRAKDPLFTTDMNERVLEQYRRFAYVTWHFAVPNLGLRGWETHRGRIYLRYGEPREFQDVEDELRWRRAESGDPDSEFDWESAANLTRSLNIARVWTYPGLRVTFFGGYITGNFVVGQPAKFIRDVERVPESVRVEGDRDVLRMYATWYLFEGASREIELIPVVYVPDLPLPRSAPAWVADVGFPVSVVLLNTDWVPTAQAEYRLPVKADRKEAERYWIGQPLTLPRQTPPTDAAYAAIEIITPGSLPAYAARDTMPAWETAGLRLSSLVLASDVAPWQTSTSWPDDTYFLRGDRAVVPRPESAFRSSEPIYVYAEVYGLSKDELGATNYELALSITTLEGRRPFFAQILDALGRLMGQESREGTVTLLFERQGIQDRAQETLRIALQEGVEEGHIVIQLTITDKNSGEQADRSTLLTVVK